LGNAGKQVQQIMCSVAGEGMSELLLPTFGYVCKK